MTSGNSAGLYKFCDSGQSMVKGYNFMWFYHPMCSSIHLPNHCKTCAKGDNSYLRFANHISSHHGDHILKVLDCANLNAIHSFTIQNS